MGLFDKRRPEHQQETPQADWQADRARVASFLYRARTFNGTGPEDPTLTIKLRPEERALLVATGTFLVEPRRVPARWAGERGGYTFRVAARSAQPSGNEADLVPVDSGDLTFTDKRIVFSGAHRSVEWEFGELLGLYHVDHPPWTAVAVSSRDRASGFRYDEGQAEEVRFATVLGLARFNDALDSLVADLQEQLDEIDRAHSAAPAQTPVPAQSSFPSGTPAGAPAWPTASPFPAAPSGSSPVGGAEQVPAPAGSVPKPSSSYMPEDGATVIDGVTPGVPAQAAQTPVSDTGVAAPDVGSEAAATGGQIAAVGHPASPSAGEMVSRALSEDVTTEPKPAEETGVPTGQIPVSPTPTATYPAVRPQQATPIQPVQQQQAQPVHQGAPSTPPGWYPDPWRIARVRWWDGYSWTSYTSH
ncbi:MAG: DUF2510 domain-containing protein [Acidimicrobiales bacterium]